MKSWTVGKSTARDAQVIVDGLHAAEAQFARDIRKRILTPLTLHMPADLAGCRLAYVHEGGPPEMISGDLRVHGPAPHRRRPARRWPAADRPAPGPVPAPSVVGSTTAGTSRSNGIGNWLGGRCRIGVLLRKIGDAIVRRARGVYQRRPTRSSASTDTRTGPVDSTAQAARSVIHTGIAAVRDPARRATPRDRDERFAARRSSGHAADATDSEQ